MVKHYQVLRDKILAELVANPSLSEDPEKLSKRLKEIADETDGPRQHFQVLSLMFENRSTNPNPEYQKDGDSGFDLRANLAEPIVIKPLKRAIIPTGLFFQLELGFEIQVRSRSGLAANNGIMVLNSPGTVDSGYRGEVKVILINLGDEPFTVNHGDRIAQAVLAASLSKPLVSLRQIETISANTDRGAGGFGHSGVK